MNTLSVEIVEVGPRDGLQNESAQVSTEAKLALIGDLLDAGVRRIEVASFVHPKLVPQMADAEAVCAGLPDRADVSFIGLVLNARGYERALATRDGNKRGIDEVGLVAVASDGFGRNNQGMGWRESVETVCALLARARDDGLPAQATISVCWGDPFDGEVPIDRVVEIACRIAGENPREIALADTTGVAVPARVRELFDRVAEAAPGIPLRAHFHDTRNTGIANVQAAYDAGVRIIDASLGGLGGCPFAPGATGNVATEDVVWMLERSGIPTGLDLDRLIATNRRFANEIGKPLPAMLPRAGVFPRRG